MTSYNVHFSSDVTFRVQLRFEYVCSITIETFIPRAFRKDFISDIREMLSEY